MLVVVPVEEHTRGSQLVESEIVGVCFALTINNVEHYCYFVAVRWDASVIATVTFPH